MDTTPEYIRMCQKATEIQELWKPEKWDFYYDEKENNPDGSTIWAVLSSEIADSGHYGNIYIWFDGEIVYSYSEKKDYSWLPRQDQLQEISGKPWDEFDKDCRNIAWDTGMILDKIGCVSSVFSKEQAGLMAVMIKFNKMWNGENWIVKEVTW